LGRARDCLWERQQINLGRGAAAYVANYIAK